MKPKCKHNLGICCLDCDHSDIIRDGSLHGAMTLTCTFDGEYCGFGDCGKDDCSDCPYDEDIEEFEVLEERG